MRLAIQITALICMACVGAAGIEIALLAHNYAKVPPLSALISSANGTVGHLNGVLDNANGAISQIRQTATLEAAEYDPKKPGSIPNQTYRLIEDTKTLIGHTDASLNGEGKGAIPALAETLRETGDLSARASVDLDATAKTLNDTALAIRPGIDNMVLASKAAADDLADPSIHATLVSTAGISANVEMTTHDIAAFVHRETAPVRGTLNVIKAFLMEFAGPAASVATAVK